MLEKLWFYGLSNQALLLKPSYLSSRRVKLGGMFSSWNEISKDAPQDSILGPTQFNIFMSDLVYAIKQCNIISYEDDTTIYCSNEHVICS